MVRYGNTSDRDGVVVAASVCRLSCARARIDFVSSGSFRHLVGSTVYGVDLFVFHVPYQSHSSWTGRSGQRNTMVSPLLYVPVRIHRSSSDVNECDTEWTTKEGNFLKRSLSQGFSPGVIFRLLPVFFEILMISKISLTRHDNPQKPPKIFFQRQ